MLLSVVVWCPDNWRAMRYTVMSRLRGKRAGRRNVSIWIPIEMENLKKLKKERKCISMIMGLEWAVASRTLSSLTLKPSHLPQEQGAERREQTGPHLLKMKRFQGCISHLSLIFGFPLNCIVVNGCSG